MHASTYYQILRNAYNFTSLLNMRLASAAVASSVCDASSCPAALVFALPDLLPPPPRSPRVPTYDIFYLTFEPRSFARSRCIPPCGATITRKSVPRRRGRCLLSYRGTSILDTAERRGIPTRLKLPSSCCIFSTVFLPQFFFLLYTTSTRTRVYVFFPFYGLCK